MRRFVAAGGALAAAIGGILWFLLLMSTAADTVIFSRNYPLLIALNILLAVGMVGLVGWQLRSLWRDYQAQVFGSRLKLRLMLMFGVIAVLPGALVYGVSVQFVTRSIESWFDVRVEKALESGLQLGRSALDSLLADLGDKGRSMAGELSDIQEVSRRSALLRLREERGVQSVALFSVGGQLLSSTTADLSSLLPDLPSPAQLKQARSSQALSTVEGAGGQFLACEARDRVGKGLLLFAQFKVHVLSLGWRRGAGRPAQVTSRSHRSARPRQQKAIFRSTGIKKM